MSSTRQLKSRIRSVRSNRQITKAMEMVAASKLRHAQDSTRATLPYAQAARELLTQLSRLMDVRQTEFFAARKLHRRLVLLVTSDRGMAGAYNSNVCKQLVEIARADQSAGVETRVVCIGRKGAQFVAKLRGVEMVAAYSDIPDRFTAVDIRPMLVEAMESFADGSVDAVDIVTTRFVNSFTQTATRIPLLPAGFDDVEVSSDVAMATFEPSVEDLLAGATTRLLESQLYQAILDARASEHSMRRMAMKSATDNATGLVDDLTLEMNKARQASITQELSEISAGVEAMK